MIVVKIELWSARNGERSEIGRMYIANDDTTAAPDRGNYTAAVCRRGSSEVPRPFDASGPAPTRVGTVKDYARLSYNVWRLVLRALKSAFPEER